MRAEARVAELEEILAAYEANALDDARAAEAAGWLHRATERARPFLGASSGCGAAPLVARLFRYMLARPGRLSSKHEISRGIATKDLDEYESSHHVDVAVCHARRVLRAIGLGDAIVTAWGRGYELRADRAAALRAWCEGRA